MTPRSAFLRRRPTPRPCRMVAKSTPGPGRGKRPMVDACGGYHSPVSTGSSGSIQDQTSALRRVYVRPPEPEAFRRWREYGWRAEPDPARAAAEHDAFRGMLAEAGAE